MSYRDEDWARGLQVARERERAHPSVGRIAYDSADWWKPHVFGALPEAVIEREFGVPIDLTRRPNGDGGIDFLLPFGVRTSCTSTVIADVKGFTYDGPDLALLVWDKVVHKSELYVMAHITPPFKHEQCECPYVVTLRGWALREEVMRYPVEIHNHKLNRPSHTMPVRDLRPMWRLHSLHQWGYEEDYSHAPEERYLTQSREREHPSRKESRQAAEASRRHRTGNSTPLQR